MEILFFVGFLPACRKIWEKRRDDCCNQKIEDCGTLEKTYTIWLMLLIYTYSTIIKFKLKFLMYLQSCQLQLINYCYQFKMLLNFSPLPLIENLNLENKCKKILLLKLRAYRSNFNYAFKLGALLLTFVWESLLETCQKTCKNATFGMKSRVILNIPLPYNDIQERR